jgi:hypothetical protein
MTNQTARRIHSHSVSETGEMNGIWNGLDKDS